MRCLCFAVFAILGLTSCQPPAEPTPVCTVAVAPRAFTPCLARGTLSATVAAPSACSWSAEADVPWITVTAGQTGRGTSTITFEHGANFDAPRLGFVTVRSPAAWQDIRVAQAGCRYGVSQSMFAFLAGGGSGAFDVVQQTDPLECGGPLQNACVWTATADVTWISITSTTPRTGDDRVTFTIAPNADAVGRLGTITVRDRTIQVMQGGR